MTGKNTTGYVLKRYTGSNFMQLDLKEKKIASDKAVPGSLHFPLLIKRLCYVLMRHLDHTMSATWSIIHYYRLLLVQNLIIALHP